MPRLTQPEFWQHRLHPFVWLLWPFSFLYGLMRKIHPLLVRPYHAKVPVWCVGNVTVGGTGKTPVVLALAQYFQKQGKKVAVLSRGYGGSEKGPLRVEYARHTAAAVGDEPLFLASQGVEVYIARKRAQAAALAEKNGADFLLMDDGLQHMGIYKDISILVVDGKTGIGNGYVLPAGPLREPWKTAIKKARAVMMIGEDQNQLAKGLHLIKGCAEIVSVLEKSMLGRPLFAFAGIGRPQKFFESISRAGGRLVGQQAFPDHHPYREEELVELKEKAGSAALVTTAKDWVRLPKNWQGKVSVIPAKFRFNAPGSFEAWVKEVEKAQ